MRLDLLFIILYLSISSILFSNVINGEIDLRNWDFSSSEIVDLSGEWIITLEDGSKILSAVPGGWQGQTGEVTYTLVIKSLVAENLIFFTSAINTEFSLTLNGKIITGISEIRPLYIPLSLEKGENIFEFKVRNHTDIFGGFRNKPFIGNYKIMIKRYELNILKDTFFTGASFIMALFFMVLFINYRKDLSTLFFALLCLTLSLRALITNDKIIFDYIPTLPYQIIIRFEYLTIYLLPLLILLFIKYYFNSINFKKIYNVSMVIGIVLPLTTILTPPYIFIHLVYLFYIYTALSGLYAIFALINYKKRKFSDATKILISILVLIMAAFYDIMIILFSSSERLILTSSMIVFILFMSFIVSKREVTKEKQIDQLSRDNIRVNKFLSKFVPNQFIKTVGMGNISEVERGDGIEKSMVVLFSSIKGFQQELKLHKSEEIIDMLNSCYSIISPIISEYGGFIDKFIDETVMAIFPGRGEDAIDAIYEISKQLDIYNGQHPHNKPINLRTGIHKGNQFIGIVGDHRRVDATVISKVVNTASRINQFTANIDRDILISEDIYEQLSNKSRYKSMFMGRIKLKGKENFIGIYSLYMDSVEEVDNLFSITMRKLGSSSLDKIEHVLRNIKRLYPKHAPTIFYLNLIEKNKKLEVVDK